MPLAYVSDEPSALQVRADTGITTLTQYVEKISADPLALVNGNDAQRGNSFVFANAIADALDVQFMQAPYVGHAPNVTALITGEVQTATLPIPPVLEHGRAGMVSVLGVAARERHALLLPTCRPLPSRAMTLSSTTSSWSQPQRACPRTWAPSSKPRW